MGQRVTKTIIHLPPRIHHPKIEAEIRGFFKLLGNFLTKKGSNFDKNHLLHERLLDQLNLTCPEILLSLDVTITAQKPKKWGF